MAVLGACPALLHTYPDSAILATENGRLQHQKKYSAEKLRARAGPFLTSTFRGQTPVLNSRGVFGKLCFSGQLSCQHAGCQSSFVDNRCSIVCKANTKERTPPTADASPLVKLAWYGSEAFGQVVGVFRGKGTEEVEEDDEFGPIISREAAREALKKDYDRSYFVTGNMSMGIYEEDCEFADPFVSFRGRRRFKQNVSNLGSFMEEVNLKMLDWQESEDKVTTKWRFSCVLGLPWRPILAASGGTDHYFDKETGKIYKHVERWDISPADGVRQLFKPNPKSRRKSS